MEYTCIWTFTILLQRAFAAQGTTHSPATRLKAQLKARLTLHHKKITLTLLQNDCAVLALVPETVERLPRLPEAPPESPRNRSHLSCSLSLCALLYFSSEPETSFAGRGATFASLGQAYNALFPQVSVVHEQQHTTEGSQFHARHPKKSPAAPPQTACIPV